ncbi:MAG: outer membrane protein [Beijerinckiaceae bacterium]
MKSFSGKIAGSLMAAAISVAAFAQPAAAADPRDERISPRPPSMVFVPVWSGLYVGVHIGGAQLDHKRYEILLPDNRVNHSPSAFIAGLQAGYNHQIGVWVVGIEGQISFTDLNQTSPSSVPAFAAAGFAKYTRATTLGTVALRFGYTFGSWMIYAKAGGAFANYNTRILLNGANYATVNYSPFGWMLGLGAEYMINANWSVKGEYNFMDMGSRTATFVPSPLIGFPEVWRHRDRIHVVKFGINYRFGGPADPVVAKY